MIILKDLLDDLRNIELSNTIFDSDENEDRKKYIPKVISILNDTLLDFYTKYSLKQEDTTIKLLLTKNIYELDSKFSQVNNCSCVPKDNRYILDTINNPFKDNLIKIITVYINGKEVPINVGNNPNSVYIITPNSIQVPNVSLNDIMSVVYSTTHDKILYRCKDYLNQKIYIPKPLEIALRAYIGYSFYNSISGQEQSAKATEYYGKYKNEIDNCYRSDLLNNKLSYIDNNFSKMKWI